VAITVAPRATGYLQAYASTTVQVVRQGVLRPAAFAQWRPLIPGTDENYLGPLFASPDATLPMTFPATADEGGVIQVWAPEPVRIEISAWLGGYVPVRQVIDLLFTSDEQAATDEIDGLQAQVADLTARVTALEGDVAVLEDRVTTLDGQVAALLSAQSAQNDLIAALQDQMTRHLHSAGDWDYLGGAMTMPEDIP
jgi:hypothetical protein